MIRFALLLSIFTFSCWTFFPTDDIYFISSAILFVILCYYIYKKDKKAPSKFILFSLSLNNLFDELLFNALEIGINEIIFAISVIIITYFKYYANKTTTTDGRNK